MVAKGEGGTGGKNRECGISRGKLLYIEWINDKVLLHSIGNYIQYPKINCNGKDMIQHGECSMCTRVLKSTNIFLISICPFMTE